MKNKFLAAVAVFSLCGKICLAQAQPDATEPAIPPPPSILPFSPLAQVIRLVKAGVDQTVILAYATNSISTFNLDSDKIIYLANLGVPNEITTAMMQRDQILQQQMAAAANTPPPPTPVPAPETPDTTADTPPPPEPAVVTVDYFQTTLTPYGSWVDIDGYGRCWRPTAVAYSPGWQPYCDRGHWVYSDAGWYWVSDYAWGATFHYGRWFHHDRFGWCWWPDTTWAPSWVTWRYKDDYCGWAPLPPFAVYRPGIGFVYRGKGVSVGFDFGLSAQFFTFVPTRNFCDPHPRRFRAESGEVNRIYGHTTVVNNINFSNHRVINDGITVQHIADATRTEIHPVPVRDLRSQNNQVLRGGNYNRQNRQPNQPNAPTAGNAGNVNPPSANTFGNGNNVGPRNQNPGQNRFSQPVVNDNQQTPQNRNRPAPFAAPNTEDDKHIASPRGQQFQQPQPLAPRPISQPSQTRDFITPLPPTVNRSAPVERPYNPPQPPQPQPQVPVERFQPRNEPAPNNPAPQNPAPQVRSVPTPPPAQSSQSQSQSQSSGRQGNGQNGQGR
jgi:hypothetical protein